MSLTPSQKAGLYLTAVELVGDVSVRDYAKHGTPVSLAVGTASYLSLQAILIDALIENKMSVVNAYWDGMSNIATMLADLALGESLTTLQIAGILTISAGLVMLEWERGKGL